MSSYAGTLLPGLIETYTHLVTDGSAMALEKVAGRTEEQLEQIVTRALRAQFLAGVTTVRDLSDRGFTVVGRRDRQRSGAALEPTVVASGPPITSPGGHCHFLGGEVSGAQDIVRAVAERAEHAVDVVKVMASGGVSTPGSDVLATQFSDPSSH